MYVQEVKRFFVQGYLDEEIFKGGTGLCRNNRSIQSIFNEKPQSSTTAGHSWLLIQTLTGGVISDKLALVVSCSIYVVGINISNKV